jgi:hypothetical protein
MSYAAYSILKRDRIMPRDEQPRGDLLIFSRRERSERRCFFSTAHGWNMISTNSHRGSVDVGRRSRGEMRRSWPAECFRQVDPMCCDSGAGDRCRAPTQEV